MSREFKVLNMADPESMQSVVVMSDGHAEQVVQAGREQVFGFHGASLFVIAASLDLAKQAVTMFTAGQDGDENGEAPNPAAKGYGRFQDDHVRRLVIAAREALGTGEMDGTDEGYELDQALEPFSAHVPYEDEPNDGLYSARSQDTSDPGTATHAVDPRAPAGPLSDDQVSLGAATPTVRPGESETNPDIRDHTSTMPKVDDSESSAIARSSATGGGIGAPNVTTATANIEDGNRPNAHEAQGQAATTGQTGSAGTAEAFDDAVQNQMTGDEKAEEKSKAYRVEHRGRGSYSIMDEDNAEVVDGLDKKDAEAFRKMTDDERATFVTTARDVREAEKKQETSEDAASTS